MTPTSSSANRSKEVRPGSKHSIGRRSDSLSKGTPTTSTQASYPQYRLDPNSASEGFLNNNINCKNSSLILKNLISPKKVEVWLNSETTHNN
jgi:hypothetical protein